MLHYHWAIKPPQIESLKIWLVLLFSLTLVITCSEKQNDQSPTGNGETTPEDTTSPPPGIQMPRSRDWALGTWIGTVPQPSQFAGKQVRLVIQSECGTVTGSSVGYYYQGSLTWDYQGAGEWTAAFQLPQSVNDSYVWWVYDASWQIETFRCDVVSNNNHVVLSTTTLGPADTSPTNISLFLTANINGVSESDQVLVPMQKQ